MIITVTKAGADIAADELDKIQQIFKESHNPNESIINTFPGATFDGHTVDLGGNGEIFKTEVNVDYENY
ncbi:hypothetical protein [Pectinatus haikarae]|uniref:Uncharacterized protein n=1 Tax=Pectinatus haikarae TaxID=349096 RepID=A0ABT9YA35_9FIRM|nr:hypothetical protein [Pectinatus haikarae]MDQ0204057.1 hypothetical protein [Pectinatus haikarae]